MSLRASSPLRGATALPLLFARLMAIALVVVCASANAQTTPAPYDAVGRLTRAGQFDDAIRQAQQYVDQHPRDPQMRFLLGVAQNEKGDVAAARDTFTRLTQEFPELPEPHNNLAVLHAAAGRYDEARVALEAAIRANPSYAVALENLGDVYARLAQRSWLRAQQIDNGNPRLAPKLKAVQGLLVAPATPN
ncbi:MAG: tetratricopeptide repeat protein [Hydrogenophaga sp.]|uniref:tetratricopeptide repeat protein n=1 Tax=Hydrogenophaga sp. TaxID=1904254 RepID=UPI001D24FE57|nr:tetratricopeptide repeat protein [Hydrogenophaga sp.]MBX3610603.1 tetratricopeptide repeat protein [Hydrogenophaga sp.]